MMKKVNLFRKISITLVALLLTTSLNTLSAQADDLSDAKASLATAEAKMVSLKLSLTNSQNELKGLEVKLSALDTATVTAEVVQGLQTQIEATKAAIAVFEGQIPKIQSTIDPLLVQIKALEAAVNAGNNCPVDWGLDQSKFSIGIESGTFAFDGKVLAEIVKEPRNVVVNTSIEFSKDGQTWSPITTINTFTWTNYGNSFKSNQNVQTIRFMSAGLNTLRYSNSQIRAVTKIEKQNCTPFVVSPDSKSFTLAAIPFAKTTFDELYKTYPEAFPNYQVRDFFTNLVTSIKTDFPAKASGGSNYYLGNSYQYNSQLVIYPRSGTCTGDINNITVQSGSNCEIGIYWIYGSNLKFIDAVSAVGGLSEAQVEQAAMLKVLTALTTTVEAASRKYSEVVSAYSDLTQKYLNEGGQPTAEELQYVRNAIDQFNALSVEFSSYQSQIIPIVKSKYLNQELNMLVQRNLKMINGAQSNLQNLVPEATNFINKFTSANSSVTNELNLSRQLNSMSKNEYNLAINYQQKLNSVLSSGGSFDSQYINEELNNLQNLLNNSTARATSVKSSTLKALKLKSSNLNSASMKILDEAISNYNASLSNYSSIGSIYSELSTKLRNANSIGITQANNFLKNADSSYANAKSILTSASTELKEYPTMLANGKIQLKVSADFDREIDSKKSMMNKVDQMQQDNRNQVTMAQKYLSGTSNAQEQQIWTASINQFNQSNNLLLGTIKVYSQMISFITSKRSGTTDESILELDGEEEDVTGTVTAKKESSSRYLIRIKSNQSDSDITIKAVKSKAKAIVFNLTTDEEGNKAFRSTRKLTGYVLQLWIDGTLVNSTKKLA
jgi:hypothetical protein